MSQANFTPENISDNEDSPNFRQKSRNNFNYLALALNGIQDWISAALDEIRATIIKPALRGGFNVDDVRYYGTVYNAVNAIPSDQYKTIFITNVQKISTSLTIPENIGIVVLIGGYFSISSGATLTFNGAFNAPQVDVFPDNAAAIVHFGTQHRPERIYPRWWGNMGNNVTDAKVTLQRFLDNGWNLYDDGDNIYKISSSLALPNNLTQTGNIETSISGNVRLRPDGEFDAIYHPYSATTAVTSLVSTVRTGARQFDVATSTGMLVGDLLQLDSDAAWPWGTGSHKSELTKIINISGNTIYVANPLFCNYNPIASGGTETVAINTFTPHILNIDGLEIIYSAPSFATVGQWGLNLQGLDGSTSSLKNITVKNASVGGMQITQSYDLQVINPTLDNCFFNGYGYGIGFNASTWCGVSGGYSYRCRHAVDYSGVRVCQGGLVTGMRAIGWSKPTDPANTSSADGGAGVFGTHVGANYISFIGNTLSDGLIGFQIRSSNTFIHDNVYWGIHSAFITLSSAAGLSAKGNVNRWQVVAPVGGGPGPNIGNYFLDVDASDADIYSIWSGFNVENNEGTVDTAFITIRNGTTDLAQWCIVNNRVTIYGSGAVAFIQSLNATPTAIDIDAMITGNTVNVVAGTYTEWINVRPFTVSPAGFINGTRRSEGPLYYSNGSAGAISINAAAKDLVLESDRNMGATFFAPNGNTIRLNFGDPTSNIRAFFGWTGSDAEMGSNKAGALLRLYGDAGVEVIRASGSLITFLQNVAAYTASGLITAAAGIKITGGTASAGAIVKDATYGLLLQGVTGGTYDFSLFSVGGSAVFRNLTGTSNFEFTGALSVGTTLLVSGLYTAAGGIRVTGGTLATGGIVKDATYGLAMQGVGGSSYDFSYFSTSGNAIFRNPTGTNNLEFSHPVSLGSTVTATSLAGTGSRLVQADSSGILSASNLATIAQTLWTKTASTTVANTTTETTLLDSGVGSKTLAAALLTVGKSVSFEIYGVYSTTLTPTIQFKFKLGSTGILDSGAITTANTVTNQAFCFYGTVTCRSTGATGTVFAQGGLILGGLTTPLVGVVNTATSTIDTTGTLAMDITSTWGSLSVSDTITSTNALIESKG